jgi:hypothetical protein
MWMMELATKTITAESRIGSHSEATPETRLAVMGTPCIFLARTDAEGFERGGL